MMLFVDLRFGDNIQLSKGAGVATANLDILGIIPVGGRLILNPKRVNQETGLEIQ